MTEQTSVLILCTGNLVRSHMAEGLLREMAADWTKVERARVSPTQLRPEAIEAMKEIGVAISSHRSKSIDEFTTRPSIF